MAFGQWRTAVRISEARLRDGLKTGQHAARSYSSLTHRPRTQRDFPTLSALGGTKPVYEYQFGNRRGFAVTSPAAFRATLQTSKDRPPEDDDGKNSDKNVVEDETDEKGERKKDGEKAVEKEEYVDEVNPALRELKKQASELRNKTPEEKTRELLKNSAGVAGRGNGGRRKPGVPERALQKASVPDVYPQLMALPITKRPLFPGFYKAVTIRDPNVAAAIQEMIKRGQPYIGAFLFKDENADSDTIDNIDEVYPTGVFAQVTSAFPVHGEEGALTAVLYPHRRIKISQLHPRKAKSATPEPAQESTVEVEDVTEEYEQRKEKGDVVASFEEPTDAEKKQQIAAASGDFTTSFLDKHRVSIVEVDNLADEPHDKRDPVIRAVTSEIVNVFKEVAQINPLFREQISTFSMSQSAGNVIEEPARLADFAAAVSTGEVAELQEVLEALSIPDRLQKSLVVLKKELMNAQLQTKISKDVEAKIQKRQREYWLMEQMKGIKRELGIESDGKDKLVERFKDKAEKLAMPEAVRKVFDEEINKLAHLEPAASEFNVTRNYLDWLTQIPWGQRSTENYSIKHAQKVLDEDHHGLADVKDRILEFIAVGKLRGTVEGKIICFVGPPGVGKTSIGKSIARALDRQFYRFSVGGLTDVAEIKGHRRTYVGALPGRIIQALKKCQTENPLVLIDEVDKIGRGHQGDPASALLELLDPEQNSSFLDHYMDVPVDLSKVLFVCTANMTDTIPRPLLDRMEMIELSGYVADEKMAIAEKYLAPQAREMSGLKDVEVNLTQEAIAELIKSYCRESGVRNLKKQIEKVFRKSALQIVKDLGESELPEEKAITDEGKAAIEAAEKETQDKVENADESSKGDVVKTPAIAEKPRVAVEVPKSVRMDITKSNLKDFVGPPVFTSDRLYDIPPPGVVMGLAWTQMGGAALYVESILENALAHNGRPGLERTGSLQDVMKESTIVAYSFVKGLMAREFTENRFFEKARVHLHCPEGATPKDGPSAGVTMATSMLSLALDHKVNPTIAMTGELTVTGKVLRIGGLREKAVAARRSGAHTIIFPADNMSDWLELPQNIKEGLTGAPVHWYSDVFDIAFKDLDKKRAMDVWKKQLEDSARRHKKENDDAKDD